MDKNKYIKSLTIKYEISNSHMKKHETLIF